jgi:GH24 family phage-related lysozyme (muramidase)
MAGYPLSYDPAPSVNPVGAPGGDYERIQASPDMFGAAVGRAVQGFGQAAEKASDTGFSVLEHVQSMDDRTHAAELHSWFSDQASDLTSQYLEKRGREAKTALPDYKASLQSLFDQAKGQAGNRDTEMVLQQQTRRYMDYYYNMAARHAASQQATWEATTAKSAAASYGNDALLAASQGDYGSVDRFLFQSDQETRNHQEASGFEGPALEAEVAKNRGVNVRNIVKQIAEDEGPGGGMVNATKYFKSQEDKVDAASRVMITNYLKGGLAKIAGEKIADDKLGRPSTPQPPEQIADVPPNFVAAIKQTEGFAAQAKWDYKQYTNGYGTKAQSADEVIDAKTANARFATALGDAAKFVDTVNPNLDPGTRAALSSLTFNAGEGWAKEGLGDAVRAGDLAKAKELFLQYNKAGGETNEGLVMRRAREASWFGRPDLSDTEAQVPLRNKGEVMLEIMNELRDKPQVQAAALAHLNKVYEAYHLQQMQGQAAFKQKLQDRTTEALTTGRVEDPIQPEEFTLNLGPEQGPAAYATYQANVQLGADIRSTAGMSPAEIDALRERYKPQPGDGFDAQVRRAKSLDAAIEQNKDERAKDPAGFLVQRTDTGAAIWKSFQTLMNDQSATLQMRQHYADIYASQMAAEQRRLGIDPEKVTILPKWYAESLASRWRVSEGATSAPGQPGNAAGILSEINGQAQIWGSNWDKVYREIAPHADPALRVVASGVAPSAGIALLNAEHVKEAQIFGTQDDTTKQIFSKAVTDALKPFYATLSGSAREQVRADYEAAARKLTAIYIAQGNGKIDATTAATQAVNDLLGFKYDFRGSIRVPKFDADGRPQPFTADQIEMGAAAAKAQLGDLDVATPGQSGPLGENYIRDSTLDALQRDGRWMTDAGEKGLKLVYGADGRAWPSKSDPTKPFILTWSQLAEMSQGRKAALEEVQKLGRETDERIIPLDDVIEGDGTFFPTMMRLQRSGSIPNLDYSKMPLSENVEDRRGERYNGGPVSQFFTEMAGAIRSLPNNIPYPGRTYGPYDKDIEDWVSHDAEARAIAPVLREINRRLAWADEAQAQEGGQPGKPIPEDLRSEVKKLYDKTFPRK